MGDVVNLDTRMKEHLAEQRGHMIMVLENAIDRVKNGTTQGLVLCEVSEATNYNSGAGRCCSHAMLGLLMAAGIDIANRINDQLEDIEDGGDAG